MRSGRRTGRTTGSAYYDDVMLIARPLRYYDMGDAGTTARNHMGQSSSNASFINAEAADFQRIPGVISGPRRSAHDFDGSSEVVTATDLPQHGLTRISMGAWIRLDTLAVNHGVIAVVHDATRRCEMFIRSTTGIIDVGLGDGSTAVDTANDGTGVVVSTWSLVGFSWDGATVRRYLNGTNTGTNASWAGSSINTATRPLYYAGRNNAGATDIRLDGLMSHAFLCDRSLSAGEWRALYLAGRSRRASRRAA